MADRISAEVAYHRGADVNEIDMFTVSDHIHQKDGVEKADKDESDANAAKFTISEAVEHIGLGRFQLYIAIITGIFTFADAMEMLLLAVLGPVLQCEWLLRLDQVAFITTIVFIGYFILAPVWGACGDRFGRKPVLVVVCIWIAYYGFLTSFSPTYPWVLVLRGIVGGGIAGAAQSFVLFSEYTPIKWRAKLLTLTNLFWTAGSIFEIMIAAIVVPTLGWRWLVGISSVPIALVVFALPWLPESARYLVTAGENEKAMRIINHATRQNGKIPLKGSLIAEPQESRGHIRDLFSRGLITTTLGSWCLWFNAAFSYYGMVLVSGIIINVNKDTCGGGGSSAAGMMAGEHDICSCELPSAETYSTMIISTFGEILGVMLNLVTLDIIGRKRSMAIYMGLMGIFFLLMMTCSPTWLLTFYIFMIRCLTTSLFNAVYIYVAEVYPTKVRSLALGSCSAAARVGAIITPFIAQVLLQQNKELALSVYAAVCFGCAIVAVIMPIETKDREMQEGFEMMPISKKESDGIAFHAVLESADIWEEEL